MKDQVPPDAFCLCCFSWFDYYPSLELNHILGEGSIDNGTVAFAFGHYAMFKEKEIIRAEHFRGDFVMAKPFDISDSLRRNEDNTSNDKQAGCYDYITEDEKEEAKVFTLECDQEGCSQGNYHSMHYCPANPNEASYSAKVLFSSQSSSLTSFDEIEDLHIENGINLDDDGSVVIKMYNDETFDTAQALPPGCSFQLSCKILRRLLRVSSFLSFCLCCFCVKSFLNIDQKLL